MFKSRKKRQQQKAEAEAQAKAAAEAAAVTAAESKYTLLEDFQLTSDFRSSVILPQLNKDLDPIKLSRQQQHLAQLRDIPEAKSPPLSPPPPTDSDAKKQYQDLAAWRQRRNQNRYSNGLFGGKQRGRPKPKQTKCFLENGQGDLEEVTEDDALATANAGEDALAEITATTTTITTTEAAADTVKDEEQDTVPNKPATQLKDMLRNEFIQKDDSEQEESDEDFIEEVYEPNSDTEENFFFQDFSANGGGNNKQRRPRANNRKHGSNKVLSRFDLSSFAKDLHDHRLSVIQPRDSRIIMTEDDELELEKLLERQRQRMSVMTLNASTESLKIVPPMPSLDLIKPHKPTSAQLDKDGVSSLDNPDKSTSTPVDTKEASPLNLNRPYKPASIRSDTEEEPSLDSVKPLKSTSTQIDIEEMPKMHSDHGSTTTTNSFVSEIHSAGSRSSQQSYTKDSTKIEVDLPREDDVPQSNVQPDRESMVEPVKPVASVSTSSIRQANQKKDIHIDRLQRSVSTTSMRSNRSTQLKSSLQPIRDEEEIFKKNARKSISMDNIHINLDANEPSVTSAALDWIAEDSTPKSKMNPIQPDTSKLLYQQAPTKSRSLFGSLRQVSRSKTFQSGNVSSIKGLVRNFSSSHQHNRSSQSSASNRDSGMSRAAMAVIQHNVTKQEQKKATSVIPDEKQDKRRSDNQQEIEQEKRPARARTKSDANTGSRLISQLIARATSRSKKSNTKVVNMEMDAAAKKRAQVVRRTIIYVQPDSLHDLLKNGGEGSVKMPPLPTPQQQKKSRIVSDGSLSPDDETVRSREYVTATKVSRQTSVRKRIVDIDPSDADQGSSLKDTANSQHGDQDANKLSRNGSNSRRRWQLQSMDEDEMMPARSKKTPSSSSSESYMEGVELREMSDGSVVWGIVKKQGNRKSFYAPNQKNEYEHVEDEVEDANEYFQQNVMKKALSPSPSVSRTASIGGTPPPIPRRSPRRQVSIGTSANYISTHSSKDDATTTDIYYSDEVTLPSLLKMMQGYPTTTDTPSEEEEEAVQIEDVYAFNERAMSSVDDQLDEMMRILTSQQEQQQRAQKIY